MLAVEALPENYDILKRNVAHHGTAVTTVFGALVSQKQAAVENSVKFIGRGTEFWGFRVDDGLTVNNGKVEEQAEFEVPTISLQALQVSSAACAKCAAMSHCRHGQWRSTLRIAVCVC